MIRLMIKEYTIDEKIALYGAITTGLAVLRRAGGYEQVVKDMDRALYWLEKQIVKEVPDNAQNR